MVFTVVDLDDRVQGCNFLLESGVTLSNMLVVFDFLPTRGTCRGGDDFSPQQLNLILHRNDSTPDTSAFGLVLPDGEGEAVNFGVKATLVAFPKHVWIRGT